MTAVAMSEWVGAYREALEAKLVERGIPGYMHTAILEYVVEGHPTGDFLRSLFSNDLMRTYGHADGTNKAVIDRYVRFLYNDLPSDCHGSAQIVSEWIKAGGLIGIEGWRH